MIKHFALVALAVTLFSCSTQKKTTTIEVEKIIFHTSVCFGDCPVYHLQVNKDKSLLLEKEESVRRKRAIAMPVDSTKTGYFKGVVNEVTFNKLMTELKTIGLDSLKYDGPNCCDGSEKTIIIYYNGKRLFFRAMFPPDKTQKLIATLYEICETSELKPIATKPEIENEAPKK